MYLLVLWTAQKSAPGYPGPVAGWSLSPTGCTWTRCEPLSHQVVLQGSPFSRRVWREWLDVLAPHLLISSLSHLMSCLSSALLGTGQTPFLRWKLD